MEFLTKKSNTDKPKSGVLFDKLCMKKYFGFLCVSYLVAILFEMNANFFFDGKLFTVPFWPIVFLVWYGLFYSMMFLIFRKRSLILTVFFGSIFGTIAEITLFHRFHPMDFLIYAIMFFLPFWFYKKYLQDKHL